MNGPDHYRRAEQLLAQSADQPASLAADSLTAAQVHATLAAAAAAAQPAAAAYYGDEAVSTRRWAQVLEG